MNAKKNGNKEYWLIRYSRVAMGPYSAEDMIKLAENGKISVRHTFVTCRDEVLEGRITWELMYRFPELIPESMLTPFDEIMEGVLRPE